MVRTIRKNQKMSGEQMCEVQGVVDPDARVQAFVCKVKRPVSRNIYNVRMDGLGQPFKRTGSQAGQDCAGRDGLMGPFDRFRTRPFAESESIAAPTKCPG